MPKEKERESDMCHGHMSHYDPLNGWSSNQEYAHPEISTMEWIFWSIVGFLVLVILNPLVWIAFILWIKMR